MKLSIATLFVLLLGASADFDIYQDDEYKDITQSGFLVFADGEQASCDEVAAAPFFKNRSDVSGKKKGVRQAMSPDVRNNTATGTLTVNKLEMHFSNSPLYHWTIYRDRGYRMETSDHSPDPGACQPLSDNKRECGNRHLTAKFRCLTDITAKDINDHVDD